MSKQSHGEYKSLKGQFFRGSLTRRSSFIS